MMTSHVQETSLSKSGPCTTMSGADGVDGPDCARKEAFNPSATEATKDHLGTHYRLDTYSLTTWLCKL